MLKREEAVKEEKELLRTQESLKVKGTRAIENGWPDACVICHAGCMNQICNSCKPLFNRGLRSTAEPEPATLSPKAMRRSLRVHILNKGHEAHEIQMHPESWDKYERLARVEGKPTDMWMIEGVQVRLSLDIEPGEYRIF